jgi:hypothetical protein
MGESGLGAGKSYPATQTSALVQYMGSSQWIVDEVQVGPTAASSGREVQVD